MRNATRPRARVTVALLALLALVAAACAPADEETAVEGDDNGNGEASGGDGEEISLDFASFVGDQHVLHDSMWVHLADEAEAATDGRVEIQFHLGGALVEGPETIDAVSTGAVDMGWALQGYTAGQFPLTEGIEMPFQHESAVDATEALWDAYEEVPGLQEEYGEVKVIGLWTHDLGELFTIDEPVETLEDFEGKRIRAPGPVQEDLLRALGAEPVSMPSPDIYDSLERGVIDGAMLANSAVLVYDLQDIVDYGTKCGCYVAAGFAVMNQDVWDSLDSDAQQAIDDVAGRELSLRGAAAYDDEYHEADEIMAEAGVEFVEPNDDELQRWFDAAEPMVQDWIDARESDGLPAQDVWDAISAANG